MKIDHLFVGPDMYRIIEGNKEALAKDVAAYDGNKLLNTPQADLEAYFEEKYHAELPVLDRSTEYVWEEECTIEVEDQFAGFRSYGAGMISVTGTRVTYTVGFLGDSNLFKVQPSTRGGMRPRAVVRGQELVFQVEGRSLATETVKREIEGFISSVEQHLGWLGPDVSSFNSQMRMQASRCIEERKKKLLAAQSMVAGLGFPIRERPNSTKTYTAPQVRRKIDPRPPVASSAPYRPEPVLDETHYQHILGVCQSMSVVLERSPSAFKDMDEEAIRQHFLVQLNGHYEGGAGGELFNKSGKTDILIREKDRNIFIAECKFWRGQKGYVETIDQLLSYLCWRDTKAAIFVFNRNKDFSNILEIIKATSHPDMKLGPIIEGETRFRYTFKSKDDPNRELFITVMAFDVPT